MKELTPFEQAERNIKHFAETAELMQNLFELKTLLEETEKLTEEEKEGINKIVEMAIINFSSHMTKKGAKWN